MRILHVVDSDGLHGAERVLLNLMDIQEKMGLHPALLSLGDTAVGPKDIEIEAEKRGLETHVLRFRNGLNLKGSLKILNSARSLRADIIHSHGYKGNILLGLVPSRFRKIPIITTLHGWTSIHFFSKIGLYKMLDSIAIRNLDGVVAVSSAILQHRIIKILRIRPVVIYNGIPKLRFAEKDFESEFPEVAAKSKNRFKILSIGRLSPEKGVDVLIKAVASTVNRGFDVTLVIIGEGNERPRLTQLISNLNLSDRVFLIGYYDKAFCFLPYFDVFVLPSYTEGFPITLLEAMQAGTPIVATRVGEVPAVLDGGRFGRLVPPGDPEALAKGIEEVYSNRQEAKQRSVGAQERVLMEYGVEKMVQRYVDLYHTVIHRKGEVN
jgi:glycosyltransferase involved in cell wall biosynthesis